MTTPTPDWIDALELPESHFKGVIYYSAYEMRAFARKAVAESEAAALAKQAEAEAEPVAWRWYEPLDRLWFDWRTDFQHHDLALSKGCTVEYAYPQPVIARELQASFCDKCDRPITRPCTATGCSTPYHPPPVVTHKWVRLTDNDIHLAIERASLTQTGRMPEGFKSTCAAVRAIEDAFIAKQRVAV